MSNHPAAEKAAKALREKAGWYAGCGRGVPEAELCEAFQAAINEATAELRAKNRALETQVHDLLEPIAEEGRVAMEQHDALVGALVPFKMWLIDGTLQLESDEASIDREPIHLHSTECEGSCDYGCADTLDIIIQRIRTALAPVGKEPKL